MKPSSYGIFSLVITGVLISLVCNFGSQPVNAAPTSRSAGIAAMLASTEHAATYLEPAPTVAVSTNNAKAPSEHFGQQLGIYLLAFIQHGGVQHPQLKPHTVPTCKDPKVMDENCLQSKEDEFAATVAAAATTRENAKAANHALHDQLVSQCDATYQNCLNAHQPPYWCELHFNGCVQGAQNTENTLNQQADDAYTNAVNDAEDQFEDEVSKDCCIGPPSVTQGVTHRLIVGDRMRSHMMRRSFSLVRAYTLHAA